MVKSTGTGQVHRITGARSSLTEDVRGRQRRYVVSMLLRTVCVLLAVVLWDVQRWLALAALAGGVLLPYFAVLLANAGRERAPGLPSTFDVPPETPLMLGPGGTGGRGANVTHGADGSGRVPTDSSQAQS
ncbi:MULTISPECIES: DUF3099 domain-containing protein [unclassified Streptomyces]|uniref:DUF3099 domain-containing protein n=1 Tax=unclassified Streptomyces TaxID=2593676 RepID=UPI0005F99165|nr:MULTISPECIES: DUF3099 domain-containing protein [unclassified Streptomyces]KJY35432.1 membrane protein [Streptomyces sp. NRRL S-495]KOV21208.1 membrane protein [Streptomyces sp. XY431]